MTPEEARYTEDRKLHLLFPCSGQDCTHSTCTFNKLNLGLVINVGEGRPFNNNVSENIEKLRTDHNVISSLQANIAASAVCLDRRRKKITRILVPVVTETLQNFGKLFLLETSKNHQSKVECSEVLGDIIEYVVKKDMFDSMQIFHDSNSTPDLSVIQGEKEFSIVNSENECEKDFCKLGCVCVSLASKIPKKQHCAKDSCIFYCTCLERTESYFFRKKRDSNNFDCNEVLPKRTKRIPNKFKDDIFGDDLYKLNNNLLKVGKMTNTKSTRNTSEIKKAKLILNKMVKASKGTESNNVFSEVDPELLEFLYEESPDLIEKHSSAEKTSTPCSSTKRAMVEANNKSTVNCNEPLVDSDSVSGTPPKPSETDIIMDAAFIWCDSHLFYNCSCRSTIYTTKHQVCVKLDSISKEMTLTEFSKKLGTSFIKSCHLFNTQKHAARTVGSLVNYAHRNVTHNFKNKRRMELKYNILSNTNSFFKKNVTFPWQ